MFNKFYGKEILTKLIKEKNENFNSYENTDTE